MHDLAPAPPVAPLPAVTRVAGVMAEIRSRIASRRLAPGARLPSVREFAESAGVSKSTVVDAYERLAAEGAITSRPGSGFYVAGATRPLSLQSLRPDLDRAIDPLWVTRQSLTCGPQVLKPGWGILPETYCPDASVQRALRSLARDGASRDRLSYASPLGYPPLREQIALRLGERGVATDPERIMLTDSASQGLDLLLRLFIEPGDTVLVDDPCYFNFLAMLLSHRARVIGVPFGRGGVDGEALEHAMALHRPRVYLTTGGPQNPTGAVPSAASAHRVLTLAERHDVIVVEDDTFADFEREPSPRLAGLDGLDRVVGIGCHSKTVSAAVRSGFVLAKPEWIDALVDLKLSTSHGNGHLASVLLHRVLTGGTYKRHLESLRTKLARDRGTTLQRLRGLGLSPLIEPLAGMFVWAELPGGLDAAAVARRALAEDVLLAPGNVFSASHRAAGFMRFNVAGCADPRVFEVLARTIRECTRENSQAQA